MLGRRFYHEMMPMYDEEGQRMRPQDVSPYWGMTGMGQDEKPTDWTPWLIGGAVLVVVLVIALRK